MKPHISPEAKAKFLRAARTWLPPLVLLGTFFAVSAFSSYANSSSTRSYVAPTPTTQSTAATSSSASRVPENTYAPPVATIAPASAARSSRTGATGPQGVQSTPTTIAPSTGSYIPVLPGQHLGTLGQLYALTAANKVSATTLDVSSYLLVYTAAHRNYVAAFLPDMGTSITNYLLAHHVNVQIGVVDPVAPVPTPFPWLAAVIVFLLLFALTLSILFHQQNKKAELRGDYTRAATGPQGVGASHANLLQADVPSTRFSDVAGAEEALADLAEFVEILAAPEHFTAVGASLPKGALLCGPPGTGKTLLARAVAGEAGVPFFAVSGADFTEIYVGVGAKRVRELFARARKAGRAIIFIDEVDAIARRRSDNVQGGDSERDNTLIALLNEMDGFRDSEVIVLAATNRPDILDPAITRPGRLDRRVEVPLPDRRGREKILAVHTREKPVSRSVDLEHLARRTSGMSGAELAQVVNEAAIEAGRARAKVITSRHFDQAIETVAMGRARTSALVTEADRTVTAWHEAGHTVCAYVQDAADKPVSVSIIPRGPAGGVTWMAEGDELFLQRSKASARLVTALGGRAAEERLLGEDFTQGAYGDLQSATQLATAMATRYGMTNLGLMVRDPQVLGQAASDGVTEVVEELLVGALERSRALLEEYRPFFDGLVTALLDQETLSASEIDAIYAATMKSSQSSPRAILTTTQPERVATGSTTRVVSVPVPAAAISPAPPVPAAPSRTSRLVDVVIALLDARNEKKRRTA